MLVVCMIVFGVCFVRLCLSDFGGWSLVTVGWFWDATCI